MPLEAATYISQLVSSDPADTDSEGLSGAHLRLIKSTLLATFPSFTAAPITITTAQLNALAAGLPAFALGSAAAPAVTFGSDATSGLWSAGAGKTDVAISGVNVAEFSSAGLNLVSGTLELAGTAAFPVASANIAASAVGTTQLAASGVTYAKIQNESATTLLGNPTGSAAAPSELTLGAGLAFSGTTLKSTGPTLVPAIVTNLKITNTTTVVTITADEASLINGSGASVYFSGVSETITTTTTGVGGMGTVTGTRAANASYFWWLISNGSVINALGSTQSTLAGLISSGDLPSGYTFAKRVGANFTDASSNLRYVLQVGNRAKYVIGTNPTNSSALVMASGSAGTYSTTTPTLASFTTVGFIPSTAVSITFLYTSDWKNSLAPGNVQVAPSNAYSGSQNGPEGSNGMIWPLWTGGVVGTWQVDVVLESTSLWWASTNNIAAIVAESWIDLV